MKVIINNCYGGFGLSDAALAEYNTRTGQSVDGYDIPRGDEVLSAIVEEMGDSANGDFASLKIVTVPDDVKWTICEYDGIEWVAEEHRTWR